ncbi:VCBS repeat-containing protein, partial [Bdellovibrionales bacterium]|nr:VCBS repeat-containing protein [Bdellovibrionales bacterium]
IFDSRGNSLVSKNLSEHYAEDICSSRNSSGGGQATIGNFDSNQETVEIAIATGQSLTVYDASGEKISGSRTDDCSSLATGVTSFDFNGDGKPEILYADERKFRVYTINETSDLQIIWEIDNTSGTLLEYPVVVDVTGDYRPEVLVVSNNYSGIKNWEGSINGLRIFEAPSEGLNESWMPSRKIWNQHAYYVYNVNDDLTASNSSSVVDDSLLSSFKRNLPSFELRCR